MAGVISALHVIWGAICWVLRGGAFGALIRWAFKIEPGTTITRIATMGALVGPFAFLADGPTALMLWASCYAASTIGYFRGAMGITRDSDILFMSAWGSTVFFVAMAPLVIVASVFTDPAALIIRVDGDAVFALIGAAAGPAYAFNKRFGRRFGTDWTERSEATVGAALVTALSIVVARAFA